MIRPVAAQRRWRVLVATDGSRGSAAALRFAAGLSIHPAAAVTVISVARAPSAEGSAAAPADGAAKALASASRTLRRAGVDAELRVVDALPGESIPEAIRRESERLRTDLVVVGSEGRDTLREWVVGGVALRLLYLASRPVAVIRPPKVRVRS
jgi:nucleotide-binding universal stress UspA family protein